MTKSMTAYAQANIKTEYGEISCEIRGVNHRYLDIAARMPEELRYLESEIKDIASKKLSRGRLDCFIRLNQDETSDLQPNPEIAAQLNVLVEQMQAHIPSMQALRAIDVLRWPGVLAQKEMDADKMKASFQSVVGECIDELIIMRQREGAKMAELITTRLAEMQAIVDQVKAVLPEIAEQYRERIETKLAEIKDQLDPSRLEQEMVIFLQKSDVAEELDRLVVHMDEVASILNKDKPAGRRLDFLMQELNREANTLGSKAQDTRITQASVDLKVLIEQMREQVQNIE
jgi:uncharacterized protein (TIGR00255 family)